MNKIGVAVTTYNRIRYIQDLLDTIPDELIEHTYVLNDGNDIDIEEYGIHYIKNDINLGSGKNKSKCINTLIEKGYEHLFVIEDDMLIKDASVFDQYVKTSQLTGIKHLNYGPGSPFNRKQTIQNFDLHNRHLLNQQSPPNPKLIVDYGGDIKVALYEHTVAMFTYYHRDVISRVGVFDPDFKSAFDHVDHTYRIIKAGYHPPFWWFADLANSHELVSEQPDAIKNSSIAKDEKKWMQEVNEAREIYKSKHGHYPNVLPKIYTEEEVLNSLKILKKQFKVTYNYE